jgi:hypothetical protein
MRSYLKEKLQLQSREINNRWDPPCWPRDILLSAKIGTKFRQKVAVAQSVQFACGLKAMEFVCSSVLTYCIKLDSLNRKFTKIHFYLPCHLHISWVADRCNVTFLWVPESLPQEEWLMTAKLQHPLAPKRKYCFDSKHNKSCEKQIKFCVIILTKMNITLQIN